MANLSSKRKLPRRNLPLVGTLLDKLPYSKLPTKGIVLRRLLFLLETNSGGRSLFEAANTVKDELQAVWQYAGYGDILHTPQNITSFIRSLHATYKSLLKIPTARRSQPSYLKKKDLFLASREELFDITVKSLHSSKLITDTDRDFLLNHWWKTISSTSDTVTKARVEKKLARQQHSRYGFIIEIDRL